jgi:hypothetical protein
MTYQNPEEKRLPLGMLLSGIVSDMRNLIVQELKLAKLEIGADLQRVKSALVMFGIGIGVLGLGAILLVLMVVHWLDAATDLPLWGAYGIVSGVLLVAGIVILIAGKKKTGNVGVVPAETAEAIKEDVGWIKARMKSNGSASRLAQR